MKAKLHFSLALMLCLALVLALVPGAFAEGEQAGVPVRFVTDRGYDLAGLRVLDADGNVMEPVETGKVYGYLLTPGIYRAVYHDDLGIFADYEDSFAVDDEPQEIPLPFKAFSENRMDGQVFVNPFYADEFGEDDLAFHEQALQAELDRVAERILAENSGSSGGLGIDYTADFQSVEDEIEAGAMTLRKSYRQRQASTSVTIYTGETSWTQDDYNDTVNAIFNGALKHTGDQCEGDTLTWERKSWEWSGSCNRYDYNRDSYYHVIAFSAIYQSDAAQEAQTAAKVNELVRTLGLSSKNDYDKILAIHQYLYENVDYDYSYERHSSYNTLIENCSVCQGFATSFYRLCLAAGLDARVTSSDSMNHGWDIVKLNGRWYYVDSTWDANRMEYYKNNGQTPPADWLPYYFLRGSDWWLDNHTDNNGISELGDEFDASRDEYDPLFATYVISRTDYDPANSNPENVSGTWGNLTWTLKKGRLTISGSGPMKELDYSASDAWLAYKDAIVSVVIKSGVTSIEHGAFGGCTALTSVTIPESVTSIGHDAFNGCTSLTRVIIPDSVTELGDCLFQDCTSLKTVQLPADVTTIARYCFLRCRSLTNVTIPTKVTTIQKGAFSGCQALESVTIPASVTSIAGGAFQNCSSLTDVYYGGSEKKWNTIMIGNSNTYLKDATIHYKLISNYDLDLPAALTTIESEAFAGGMFKSVRLSETTYTIGSRAFADCPNLRFIYIPKATTGIAGDAFDGVSNLTIFGRSGSYAESFAAAHGYTFTPVA